MPSNALPTSYNVAHTSRGAPYYRSRTRSTCCCRWTLLLVSLLGFPHLL